MNSKKQRILSKTIWFRKKIRYNIDFFEYLIPQRKVSEHPKYKSGTFYSEKCQREIQYESGIELNFIKQLEQDDKVKFYYEQPVRLPYRRGKRKLIYTPDFGIYLQSGHFILAEIKTLDGMLEDKVQTKVEALLDFCNNKGFGFLLTDGKHTFNKLLKTKYNKKLEKEILAATEKTTLRRRQYNEIIKRCNSTQNELFQIIIRNNLKYKSFPFKLQTQNKNQIFRQVFIEKKKYDKLITEKFEEISKNFS